MNVFRKLISTIRHPQNSGQAIIVLALGFIGLVGFVGIVTDVSILLARYNTLSRAVDSAAISAAGQMRSDRSFAEVGLAARMMLELHGIDSNNVQVETCASSSYTDGSGNQIGDPVLCSEANRYRKLVRVGARIMSPTVFLRLLGIEDIELSAVSTSETAVLDIVMVMDVSESMLLDTTYADWANIGLGMVYVPPVAGVTELQPNQQARSVLHRKQASGYFNYPTSRDPSNLIPDQYEFWGIDLLGTALNTPRVYPEEVNRRLYYVTPSGTRITNNPHAATEDQHYKVVSFAYPGALGAQSHPRTACRVRFWPYSINVPISQSIRQLPGFATYWEGATSTQTLDISNKNVFWGGFVPSYDFYGCCNDPTYGGQVSSNGTLNPIPGQTIDLSSERGDFKFNDLICQPFKQARDAAREFLQTIDFERGDRVAFVTFDRGAFLVDPDGSGGKVYNSNEACPRDPAPDGNNRTTWTHMMASLCRAQNTLDQHIGVRAEPNFYQWNENGGGWNAFAKGRRDDGTSLLVDYYHEGQSGNYAAHCAPNAVGCSDDRALTDYPVRDFCPFNDAAIRGAASLYTLWDWDLNNLQYIGLSTRSGLQRLMIPTPNANGWGDLNENQGYERQASCRGTNIGAGLREGNNALLDPTTTRRTGTVWVMIMLSDGAAGASDPVRMKGRKPLEAAPFRDYGLNRVNWQTYAGIPNLVRYGSPGEYGAFGLCPIGTPSNPSQLTRNRSFYEFPFCSDEDPSTRHFCKPFAGDPGNVGKKCPSGGGYGYGFAPGSFDEDYDCNIDLESNLILGRIYDVDIGDWPNESSSTCDPLYDVDDYARDWADYVGLSRTGAGDEQLPTIFTIGFGLNFLRQDPGGYIDPNDDPSSPSYVPYSTQYNVADFLGEELLRYIADVGDNFQIDTDYQQDLLEDGVLHGYLNEGSFGPRGACEDQTLDPSGYIGDEAQLRGNGRSSAPRDGGTGTMVRPLPPRQDCGNYYNAPDQSRLQLVFEDIATRMFTRLAP